MERLLSRADGVLTRVDTVRNGRYLRVDRDDARVHHLRGPALPGRSRPAVCGATSGSTSSGPPATCRTRWQRSPGRTSRPRRCCSTCRPLRASTACGGSRPRCRRRGSSCSTSPTPTSRRVIAWAEAGVGGLLSRDVDVDDVAQAVQTTASGGTVCSPRLAALLLRRLARSAEERPVTSPLTSREREIAAAARAGPVQQGDRRPPADRAADGQEPRPQHPHQAQGQPAGPGGGDAARRALTGRFSPRATARCEWISGSMRGMDQPIHCPARRGCKTIGIDGLEHSGTIPQRQPAAVGPPARTESGSLLGLRPAAGAGRAHRPARGLPLGAAGRRQAAARPDRPRGRRHVHAAHPGPAPAHVPALLPQPAHLPPARRISSARSTPTPRSASTGWASWRRSTTSSRRCPRSRSAASSSGSRSR